MALGADIKVRVSLETKAALQRIADTRTEGTAISDIAREAIGEFIAAHDAKRHRAAAKKHREL